MLISALIDKVLYDLQQPSEIGGFWSRTDVLIALDYIQREISRLTENVFATTALIEPAALAETITIDANGNFLRGLSAYRTYGGSTREIFFYNEEQVASADIGWKTRTAALIRGILTDITAPGVGRLYPIPDNADNDIVVNYIKQATHVTVEYTVVGGVNVYTTIEIPDCDIPCLEYGMKALIYDLETDGKDTGKTSFYKRLYGGKDEKGNLYGELGSARSRVARMRGSTFSTMRERIGTDSGMRTRPLYPWEV